MSYTVGSTRVINTTSASGTTDFTFTFPYIKEDHIEVYKEYVKLNQATGDVIGANEYKVITNVSPKLIRLGTATTAANVRIEIRRNSSLDTPLVDYADGSTLTANDLDTSALQSLYIDQELKDSQFQTVSTSATTGHPTLNSNLLTEVADPVNAQDAATKNYTDTTFEPKSAKLTELAPIAQTTAEALADLTASEVQALDGITASSAQLNTLDGITSDVTELNILDGKTFRNSDGGAQLDTTSDTQIPSSKVIAAHVASSQLAIGGFITIADELRFPTTANMPENGVVVSINNADGVIVNSSGVSVSGRTTDGTPATVTINGFPSSLYGETLAASTGLIVTATSTTNTYNYHKLLATETDIKQLSDTINDFHSRFRIASADPGTDNDDGDLYWNTATNTVRVYEATNNAGWRDLVTAGKTTINGISASTNTGGGSSTFNGVNNNGTVTGAYRFQLNNVPSNAKASQFLVSLDGAIQEPNNGTYGTGEDGVADQPSTGAFSITGNDIIFASPPLSGTPYFILTIGTAVDIGAPSDNTVTSAKIVDGAITEPKLAVTGTPTTSDDNKVLKYRNDGTNPSYMEWGDPHPEGTVVKSTTNSNEDDTKFLRADGDGTCSWQTPLPAVTATANGAIAANKPVIINSEGKLEEVAQSGSASTGSTSTWNTSEPTQLTVSYDTVNKKILVIYLDGNCYGIAGTESGGTISWGTPVQLANVAFVNIQVEFDASIGQFIVAGLKDAGVSQFLRVWITSTDTVNYTSYTFDDESEMEGSNLNAVRLALEGNGHGTYWYLNSAGAGNNEIKAIHLSYSSSTFVQSSDTGIDVYSDNFAVTYVPKIDSYLLIRSTTSGYCYMTLVTRDGDTYKINHEIYFLDNVFKMNDINVAAHGNEFLAVWRGFQDNDSYKWLFGHTGTVDNGRINIISREPPLQSSGWGNMPNSRENSTTKLYDSISNSHESNLQVVFYEAAQKYYVSFLDDGTGNPVKSFLVDTKGGYYASRDSVVTINSTSDGDGSTNVHHNAITYNPDSEKIIHIFTDDNDGKALLRTEQTTNVTADNFIGFSTDAISDTATGTINVVGNQSTQSGLTTGKKYYVTKSGALSTTPDYPEVEAGVALSSTKLLIK